ncbi:MAG: DUF2141 domain-containing protein [Cyclobacteriaceae bacterium]
MHLIRMEEISKVQVIVEGIETDKGNIRLAFYDSPETFTEKPIKTAEVPVNGKSKIETEIEIPYGAYAIAVYHDINSNGKLDTKIFGIPSEPYGFSNDYRPTMSKPDFEDALINIEKPTMTVRLKVE